MKTSSLLLLLLLGLLATIVTADLSSQKPIVGSSKNTGEGTLWTLCGDPSTHLLKAYDGGVSITPLQPKVGEDLNIKVNGLLASDVPSGKIKLSLKLMNFIKLTKSLDLCETLDSDHIRGTSCPFNKGDFALDVTASIPNDVPKVPVNGDIVIADSEGRTVTCIRIKLRLL
ncbi:4234_t:CDS:2 [Paraglomus occultum]|uniref:Phosphatidylglycerol/phosphatidylinositol transfer protein n=1 Tax=Paraglomus occultum TaxID=144539 RepID=A0A9N9AZY4_9GLOM|nr:4234_t:CDS:2 [Paraglomus occultum]